jgi:hypothetical protein
MINNKNNSKGTARRAPKPIERGEINP